MKNTRELVDPELLPGLDMFPDLNFDLGDIPELRKASIEALPLPESYCCEDVRIERTHIPSVFGAPDIPVIIYRPVNTAGPLPCFLNIHGGGYLFGSAADTGPGDVRTCAEVGCVVISPDYRLAPETKAPGALEDCHSVLAWIHGSAAEMNIDPERLAIGGMSAGGGIAASLALYARDRGEIPLVFQMLIYPMIDDRTVIRDAEHDNPHTGEFVWTREANRIGWSAYLGGEPGRSGVSAYSAAARAEDLSALPPTYLTVGALDLFLEENIEYAKRLLQAGVATELHVVPGAFHGFELAAESEVAKASETHRRAALARAFRK